MTSYAEKRDHVCSHCHMRCKFSSQPQHRRRGALFGPLCTLGRDLVAQCGVDTMGQKAGKAAAERAAGAARTAAQRGARSPAPVAAHGGAPEAVGGAMSSVVASTHDAATVAAAAAASRHVQQEHEVHPMHHKDEQLVAGLMELDGAEAISVKVHEESRRQLLRYYEAQQAARAEPLPRPDEGGAEAGRAPTEGSAADQLVLRDARSEDDLLDEQQLMTMFNLYREDPEVWTAEALAEHFKVEKDMVEAALDHCTVPLIVKVDNSMYGAWAVVNG